MRRPIERVLHAKFLAESEEGLDRLIKENIKGQIIEIKKKVMPYAQIAGHMAYVVYKPDRE